MSGVYNRSQHSVPIRDAYHEGKLLGQMDLCLEDQEKNKFLIAIARTRKDLQAAQQVAIDLLYAAIVSRPHSEFKEAFHILKTDIENIVKAICPSKNPEESERPKTTRGAHLKKIVKASAMLPAHLVANTTKIIIDSLLIKIPVIMVSAPALVITKILDIACKFADSCIRAVRWLGDQFAKGVSAVVARLTKRKPGDDSEEASDRSPRCGRGKFVSFSATEGRGKQFHVFRRRNSNTSVSSDSSRDDGAKPRSPYGRQ